MIFNSNLEKRESIWGQHIKGVETSSFNNKFDNKKNY